jgi:hypothetical protein
MGMPDEIETCPNCGSEDLEDVSDNLRVCTKCNALSWLEDGRVQHRIAQKIETMKATPDRRSGIVKVTCPGCQYVNEFPRVRFHGPSSSVKDATSRSRSLRRLSDPREPEETHCLLYQITVMSLMQELPTFVRRSSPHHRTSVILQTQTFGDASFNGWSQSNAGGCSLFSRLLLIRVPSLTLKPKIKSVEQQSTTDHTRYYVHSHPC